MTCPLETAWSVECADVDVTHTGVADDGDHAGDDAGDVVCVRPCLTDDEGDEHVLPVVAAVNATVAAHVASLHNDWLQRRHGVVDGTDEEELTGAVALMTTLDDEIRGLREVISAYDVRLRALRAELNDLQSSVTYAFLLGVVLAFVIGGIVAFLTLGLVT